MDEPLYYIENQTSNINPHDNLEFEQSARIIIDHVRKGVELARKNNLPEAVVDFIRMHHGTTTVQYFYRSYLSKYPEADVDIRKFSYPGPKPNSKETAIVMMADSVEAAMRTLKDPANDTVKDMVHKIINNKFIDGQFDECDLTLKDLERIASVFIRILSGIYHTRINYPDEKQEPRT